MFHAYIVFTVCDGFPDTVSLTCLGASFNGFI